MSYEQGIEAAAEAVWNSLPLRDATAEPIANAAVEAFLSVQPTLWRCVYGLTHEYFDKRPGTGRCNPEEYLSHRDCGWVTEVEQRRVST